MQKPLGLRAEITRAAPEIAAGSRVERTAHVQRSAGIDRSDPINWTRRAQSSIRIEGKIISRNDNGRFSVRTDRGDIELRAEQPRDIPPKGESVRVDISEDGKQARIYTQEQIVQAAREAPEARVDVRGAKESLARHPVRESATPVQVDVQRVTTETPQAQTHPAQREVQKQRAQTPYEQPVVVAAAARPVRIEALPAQEALSYIAQPTNISLQSLVELSVAAPIIQEAQLIAQAAQNALLNTSANILSSTQTSTNFFPSPQNQQPQILQSSAQQPLVTFNAPDAKVPPTTVLQPNLNLQTPKLIMPTDAPLATTSAIPTIAVDGSFIAQQSPLITASATASISSPIIAKSGEVQITQTAPPIVNIVAPQAQQNTEVKVPFEALKQELSYKFLPLKSISYNSEPITQQILMPKQAGDLQALVVAQTKENLPVIAIPIFSANGKVSDVQFFIMHQPQAGSTTGSLITLSPLLLATAHTGLSTSAGAVQSANVAEMSWPQVVNFFTTPTSWPLMDEISRALAQAAPAQVAQAMAAMTPSPAAPAQLGPAMMFFIAALKGGDLQQWLGDRAANTIKGAGKGSLLSRLGQEGSAILRLSTEPSSQEWRSMALPLHYEHEYHKIALHYRHEKNGDNDDNSKNKQVRFIFDLNLDVMGEVQLDALFRAPRLDLIVRTGQPFSQAMMQEMRRAYVSALEQSHVTGELTFQNKPEQWVKINREEEHFGVSA